MLSPAQCWNNSFHFGEMKKQVRSKPSVAAESKRIRVTSNTRSNFGQQYSYEYPQLSCGDMVRTLKELFKSET